MKWNHLNIHFFLFYLSFYLFVDSRVESVFSHGGGFDPNNPEDLRDDSMTPPFTREALTNQGWLHHRAKSMHEHLFGFEEPTSSTILETQKRIHHVSLLLRINTHLYSDWQTKKTIREAASCFSCSVLSY